MSTRNYLVGVPPLLNASANEKIDKYDGSRPHVIRESITLSKLANILITDYTPNIVRLIMVYNRADVRVVESELEKYSNNGTLFKLGTNGLATATYIFREFVIHSEGYKLLVSPQDDEDKIITLTTEKVLSVTKFIALVYEDKSNFGDLCRDLTDLIKGSLLVVVGGEVITQLEEFSLSYGSIDYIYFKRAVSNRYIRLYKVIKLKSSEEETLSEIIEPNVRINDDN